MGMASAEGAVRYTLAHAFTPKIPRAMTSKPTTSKAAITKPLAPPGNFLIFVLGPGLENFQMKIAERIAITMMVTAKNFAMMPSPWPVSARLHESVSGVTARPPRGGPNDKLLAKPMRYAASWDDPPKDLIALVSSF